MCLVGSRHFLNTRALLHGGRIVAYRTQPLYSMIAFLTTIRSLFLADSPPPDVQGCSSRIMAEMADLESVVCLRAPSQLIKTTSAMREMWCRYIFRIPIFSRVCPQPRVCVCQVNSLVSILMFSSNPQSSTSDPL